MIHNSSDRQKRPYHFQISQEYIHEIKRRAGLIGGRKGGLIGGPIGGKNSHGGGRPKGSTIAPSEKRVNCAITRSAHETFSKCANYDGLTMTAFIHLVAESLRADQYYAHLFRSFAYPAPPTEQQPQ